jgi:hypothetical protein
MTQSTPIVIGVPKSGVGLVPLRALKHPPDTQVWKLEAAFYCEPCSEERVCFSPNSEHWPCHPQTPLVTHIECYGIRFVSAAIVAP